MRRIAVVAAVVVLSVVAGVTAFNARDDGAPTGALAAVPTPTRTPTPKPGTVPTPTRTPIPPPVVPAPAAKLDAIPLGCSSPTQGGARVLFLWGPSHAGPQWLDLSIDNNGFAPGDFAGRGAFAPDSWGFMWDGLIQGMTHYVRIDTLTSQGWMASETVSFFTPICDPADYGHAPDGDMLALRDRIASAIGGSGINTAVAITDLRTRETIDVNGGQNRLPGCTINLFALMRTVEDLQFGRYPEPPAGDLIARTIYGSNPITARDLVINYVGGGDEATGVHDVNDFVHSLGMSSTLMDHPPAYPWESFYGLGDNEITALDVNRGLQTLWDGRVLLPDWRDYLLQKMTGVKPGLNYLIPAGVGYGATVSHKNGFLYSEGWADNDIGIVWFQRGGQRYGYAISFYTEDVPSKYADIGLGQRISSLAYQWFVGRYGYP